MVEPSSTGFDVLAYRQALGKFATGVTVITTRESDGNPRGFTANSFTSVSLDPPLVLVCIANSAASCDVFCKAPHFAVNVLGDNQKDISNLFASQRPDKFDVAEWRAASSGPPLIHDALAWFECSQEKLVDAGDHIILIGKVRNFDARDGQPLGYFSGNYFNLEVEQTLVDAIASNTGTVMGAVFQKGDAVLLCEDEKTGNLTIPEIGRNGGDVWLQRLSDLYSAKPLEGTIEFVYSVFEDKEAGSVTIYYRGHATGDAPEGHQFYKLDSIPWDRIKYEPVKIMLKRFGEEFTANQFAIYMGDEIKGVVRPIM